ncbi:hypothetical protein A0J61_03758 [Choanephora cucurbitarum]|uniref:Uncharacterized protein n=1 Tax=Choanephora cucurbitarum TaxID=101091 RepID=A0A1C7NHF7_9FUNG|nr:hypothetical protein A0J61_03758 [Choanephora cucurbitarum]
MVRTKKDAVDSLSKNKNIPIQESTDICAIKSPISPLPCTSDTRADISRHTEFMSNFHMISSTINDHWQAPLVSNLNHLTIDKTKATTMQKLQSLFRNLSAIEISEMLSDCDHNEDEVILRLITHTYYLENIRCRIQQRASAINSGDFQNNFLPKPVHNTSSLVETPTIANSPEEKAADPMSLARPKKVKQSTKKSNPETNIQLKPKSVKNTSSVNAKKDEPVNTNSDVDIGVTNDKPILNRKRSRPNEKAKVRLNLDDALQQIQSSSSRDSFEGWSEARLRAYQMLDTNPNEYYYRFNAPGELQRTGKWNEEEHALFLKRLAEHGANSQWGIFSIAIPGRVGYQCSNYYRQMIKKRQIHDPNYIIDTEGNVHYLFDKKNGKGAIEKTLRIHSKHRSVPILQCLKEKTQAKRKRTIVSDEDEGDDVTYSPKKVVRKKKKLVPRSEVEPHKPLNQHPSSDIEKAAIIGSVNQGRMTRRRYQELRQ